MPSNIDESIKQGESPAVLVERLARQKAYEVAKSHPQAIIIGCDQIAVLGKEILGKPGSIRQASQQLQKMSAQRVDFLTGLAVLNTKSGALQYAPEVIHVYFRELTDAVIARYLEIDRPLDCAGSFKSEALGITLTSKIEGNDPYALIGLPLIRLSQMLRHEGFRLP